MSDPRETPNRTLTGALLLFGFCGFLFFFGLFLTFLLFFFFLPPLVLFTTLLFFVFLFFFFLLFLLLVPGLLLGYLPYQIALTDTPGSAPPAR